VQWFDWQWRRLEEFEPRALYEMLGLRQRIFVIEQRCVYLDVDGVDPDTEHLTGHDGDTLACCLRLLPPGVRGREAAIGRVAVDRRYRRRGLAGEMMRLALERVRERHGDPPVRLAAQTHLEAFYAGFGFEPVSPPYDDDGIEHVDMLREPGEP
jgi:ElaA protein